MSRREPHKKVLVGCPFYLRSGDISITCEGHRTGVKTVSLFSRTLDKSDYEQRYCAEGYRHCPVYGMAMEKYRDRP